MKSIVKICTHRGCNKKAKKGRLCYMHAMRRIVSNNPLNYAYLMLKHNARRRGIPFFLSREEFALFCAETNYLEERGRHKYQKTIDRIDREKGYAYDNIQVLRNDENVDKYINEEAAFVDPEHEYPF